MESGMDPIKIKTCPACNTLAEDTDTYCSACGYRLADRKMPDATAPAKWYHNVWVVLFFLFFVLGPFGLPLVWASPKFSKTVKLMLTFVMIIYSAFLVFLTAGMLQAISQNMSQLDSVLRY